jgi:flagellar assembly factor FliW
VATRVTLDAILTNPGEAETGRDTLALDTRFGRMELARSNIIGFPSGLLGFAAAREFALVQLDNPKYQMFRILQCVSDATLSFIVFPPSPESGLIDAADIEAAGAALRYAPSDLVVLLLVTVRKSETGHQLTVNLRAPVLIDSSRFLGVQYVLPNERYPVRFPL